MRRNAKKTPPTGARLNPITVRVDRNPGGAWEVAMPDQRERITCETLDDARRVAYLCAAHTCACELIVCDAYHRVVQREFINGRTDRPDAHGLR